ncbi:hypothetical protein ACSBR1_023232 [Camellia fascicularis]
MARKKASLAVVLRYDKGTMIEGLVNLSYSSSMKQGEARAVRLACTFLQSLGLNHVQIERDKNAVIELRVSELVPPWNCLAILQDISQCQSSKHYSFS